MKKWLLISLISIWVAGCHPTILVNDPSQEPEMSIKPRHLPIPLDEELDPPDFDGRTPTLEDIELNPILKDSIITLEEQQELMEMIEKLLEELAYYRKLYYLQLLKK